MFIGPKKQINQSKYLKTSLVENKIQGGFIFGNFVNRSLELKYRAWVFALNLLLGFSFANISEPFSMKI